MKKKITKSNIKNIYRLSSMQSGLLFNTLLNPDASTYFVQLSFRLDECLEIEHMESSLQELVSRYDILRTVFLYSNVEEPVQIVLKDLPAEFKFEIIRTDKNDIEGYINRYKKEDRLKGFDLSIGPLFRLHILKISECEYELIWSFHHILIDGWSLNILISDYLEIYESKRKGSNLKLPLVKQYIEYIRWYERRNFEDAKDYWNSYLKGYEVLAGIPKDQKAKLLKQQGLIRIESYEISKEKSEQLKLIAAKNNVTFNTLIQSAWGILLSKYNNCKEVVFGSVVSGRPSEIDGIENMVGLFLNTLPVRIHFGETTTFIELLQCAQKEANLSEPNHYYPLSNILSGSHLKQNLFDHILNFESYPVENRDKGTTDRSSIQDETKIGFQIKKIEKFDESNYNLSVVISDFNGLKISYHYNEAVHSTMLINNINTQFELIFDNIIKSIQFKVNDVDIITKEEKHKLLFEFNSTCIDYPEGKSVITLFEEQCVKNLDNVAIEYNDRTVSYRDISTKSTYLARILKRKGIKANTIVGIYSEHSSELIIAILGVLKAGGVYLPIDPALPYDRVRFMVKDTQLSILLASKEVVHKKTFFKTQKLIQDNLDCVIRSVPRDAIVDLKDINFIDRSVLDYEKYHKFIGQASIKNSISIQATRGCPYKCAYCHKIWPKKHVYRAAEDIYEEVLFYYKLGVKNFSFVDDIFNLNIENSSRFFKLVIKDGIKVRISFPNGLRGDILTKEYIDLMIQAGVVQFSLALETASPRLQKLLKKNLNLEKLRENIVYICERHPEVMMDLFTMHGFPTETEEEARMTLDFIKSIKWLHFPYINILKIYPNTDIYELALQNGISQEDIDASEHLAHHELPRTLPFAKEFTLKYQAEFLTGYFLSKERLLKVLPHQMKLLSEDEIIQKYNGYLPIHVKSFDELLKQLRIEKHELLGLVCKDENADKVENFNLKLAQHFKVNTPQPNALRILLIDLSQLFNQDATHLYNVVEPPLGLMYINDYLKKQLGAQVNAKIIKSGIDFNSYVELKQILEEFKPELIGVRTIIFFRDFYHKTVSMIKNYAPDIPIIAGGPYATSNTNAVLQDKNIDYVVLGEGEITFYEFVKSVLDNNKRLPSVEAIRNIAGIAYSEERINITRDNKEMLLLEELIQHLPDNDEQETINNYSRESNAYIIYTSGSTGKPKGALISQNNLTNYLTWATGAYGLREKCNFPLFTSISFDLTITSIFSPLVNGGKIIIINEGRIDEVLYNVFTKNHINIVKLTPAHLRILKHIDISQSGVKKLILGGEKLESELCKEIYQKFNGDIRIFNEYGPTEATVGCMIHEYDPIRDKLNGVSIGKPAANVQIYILDESKKMIPIGCKGEIYIGGAQVFRGYVSAVDMTSKSLINNPSKQGDYIYKTGDLARWLTDGTLEFIGRKDNQVKIHGYRIELGEIESQIKNIDGVKDVVLKVWEKHNTSEKTNSFEDEESLVKALEKYRNIGGKYDVLVPVSGGVDSCFTLIQLVMKYKLKPLVFHLDNGWGNSIATENVVKLCNKLNVDCKILKGDNTFLCKLFKYFNEASHPELCTCTVCGDMLYAESIELADSLNIPLVINGYSKGQVEMLNDQKKQRRLFAIMMEITEKTGDKEFIETFRSKLSLMNKHKIYKTREDLEKPVDFNEILFIPFFVFQFYRTDKEELRKICQDVFDWQPMPHSYPARTTNCDMIWLNSYIDYNYKGFTLLHQEYSTFIRNGEMSRGQALEDLELNPSNGVLEDLSKKINLDKSYLERKLKKNLKVCKKCILPETYPGISFDETGICNFCNEHIDKANAEVENKIEKDLCAYIVCDSKLDSAVIKNNLSKSLPDYMIPSYYVQLEKIPLTSNGKIDIKSLPDPEIEVKDFIPPKNEIEEKLVEIWSETLKVNNIGINNNYFSLGGDSINSIILINKVVKRFNVNVSISDLYECPTIEEFSVCILNSDSITIEDNPKDRIKDDLEKKKQQILFSNIIPNPENIEDIFPASDIQKGMIYHSLVRPGVYHQQLVYLVSISEFDSVIMDKALLLMMNKHSILRTGFMQYNNNMLQVVYRKISPYVQHYDITEKKEAEQLEIIKNHLIEDRIIPFNIQTPGLWRIITFKLNSDNCCIAFILHHAISDGWSEASLQTELNNIYYSLQKNADFVPDPLASSYKDFVVDQIAALDDKESVDYWQRELSDYKRFSFPSFNEVGEFRRKFKRLPDELNEMLNTKSKKTEISIKHLCFSAFVYALNMFSYDNDITIGLITNNRPIVKDADKIIGCFLNTVPVRTKVEGKIDCNRYLQSINNKLNKLKKYESISLSKIVEIINEPSSSSNPITDIIFSYVDFYVYQQLKNNSGLVSEPSKNSSIDSNTISRMGKVQDNSFFSFTINNTDGVFRYDLLYFTSFICEEHVNAFFDYFERILSLISSENDSVITKEAILYDKSQLLYAFNNKEVEYPKKATVVSLFKQSVSKYPDRICIKLEDTSVSFDEVDKQSDIIASILIEKGCKLNEIVAIKLDRSIDMVLSILGVLKAGAVYMPIDVELPKARIKMMLADSNCDLMITKSDLEFSLEERKSFIYVDEIKYSLYEKRKIGLLSGSNDIAYIIYTSGTTGIPKGVIVEHRNIVRLFFNDEQLFDFKETDIWTLFHSFNFDFSVWEMYGALFYGGRVVLIRKMEAKDVSIFTRLVEKEQVTILNQTPTAFYNFVERAILQEYKFHSLRYVIFGGEALQPIRLKEWKTKHPTIKLINMFGITETTVHVTYKEITDLEIEEVVSNIGLPIPTTSIYILDEFSNSIPKGCIGEICVGGEGVSSGYLNRTDLTASKFVDYSKVPGETIYRSGDLGRHQKNGDIEYLGRIDNQIQLRGYRIELGEIENEVLKYPEMKGCIVVSRKRNDENIYLSCYYAANEEIKISDLRVHLAKSLPEYMLPSYFIHLKAFPVTSNGKVNKKALPEPEVNVGGDYVGPRNEFEKQLAEIWMDVLKVKDIGIHDNYFSTGGDSMNSISLINRVISDFNVNVSISDLYANPTIEEFSACVLKSTPINNEDSEKDKIKAELEKKKQLILTSNLMPNRK